MVSVVITAPRGHMDSLIVKAAYEREDIRITGGVGPVGREYIGSDIGLVSGLGRNIGALVSDNLEDVINECDLVVDFSRPQLSMGFLKTCRQHKKAFLCGTTGFSPEQEALFEDAADEIPVMKAANTSFVVNVMRKLLGQAAKNLGSKAKIEIIDLHSETKIDAPSGTALELAEEISEQGKHPTEEIVFHSVRAGDIPSSHKVIFGCKGEMLEISHHAYSWECYATGACDAIQYLAGQEPGLYTMDDIIQF